MTMDKHIIKKLSQIQGFIFDLDGTLINSEQLIVEEVKKILPSYGISPEEINDFTQAMRGINRVKGKETFFQFFEGRVPYEPYQKLLEKRVIQRIESGGLQLLPGAQEMVDFAKKHGKTALASSTPEKLAEKKLEMVGLNDAFGFCIFGDQLSQSKPDPQIFYLAAEAMDLEPQRILVLEDSNNGAKAGIDGGFPTFFIEDLSKPDSYTLEKSQGYFQSLVEVLALLEGILD